MPSCPRSEPRLGNPRVPGLLCVLASAPASPSPGLLSPKRLPWAARRPAHTQTAGSRGQAEGSLHCQVSAPPGLVPRGWRAGPGHWVRSWREVATSGWAGRGQFGTLPGGKPLKPSTSYHPCRQFKIKTTENCKHVQHNPGFQQTLFSHNRPFNAFFFF